MLLLLAAPSRSARPIRGIWPRTLIATRRGGTRRQEIAEELWDGRDASSATRRPRLSPAEALGLQARPHRYLNMNDLKEHKKTQFRQADKPSESRTGPPIAELDAHNPHLSCRRARASSQFSWVWTGNGADGAAAGV